MNMHMHSTNFIKAMPLFAQFVRKSTRPQAADILAHRLDRQTDRKADRQKGRQTDKQTEVTNHAKLKVSNSSYMH